MTVWPLRNGAVDRWRVLPKLFASEIIKRDSLWRQITKMERKRGRKPSLEGYRK
jgi:hypothetical protein